MITLVDGTVPVAADFNSNYTALNQVCGTTTAYTGYTAGDLPYASAATALSKLGIGKPGQVVGVSSSLPAYGSHYAGHLFGLTMSNSAGDPTNDIDVAVGEAVSIDTTFGTRVVMALTTAITKQLDATWAVGSAAGGLDTGSIANGTYHVWLIMRSDTGVVDVLFSTSASAPTMPTNYDKKRRIGSILRESAAIVTFVQSGDRFYRKTAILDVSATNPGTSAVTRTLSVPTGLNIFALFNVSLSYGAATASAAYFSDLDVTDSAASFTAAPLGQHMVDGAASNNTATGGHTIRTNTSAQIRSRLSSSGAGTVLSMATLGWVDTRGREA